MRIVVFDRYYAKNIVGFSESFHRLLHGSLEELGFEVSYVSEPNALSDLRDSIVLFIVKPENFSRQFESIHASNKTIWWNLEPTDVDGQSYDSKLKSRTATIDNIVKEGKLQRLLFFNKDQAIRHTSKDDFLPIGYHESLSYTGFQDKQMDTIFIGHRSVYRNMFFTNLNDKLKKHKLPSIECIEHSTRISFEERNKRIFKCQMGLDCPAHSYERHIHWHRIMTYIANRAVVITSSNLDMFGFKDGVDYIRYDGSVVDCVAKIRALHKYKDVGKISDRALERAKADFYMPNLLRGIFDE